MKPNTKSVLFKLSLLCFGLFIMQLFAIRAYVQHVVVNGQSTSFTMPLYWLSMIWISLGSVFYYKTTKQKQSFERQLLVFILAPITFTPLTGILYGIIVLLPLYSLVSQH